MVDQNPTAFFESLYDATYAATLRYLTRRCPDPAELPDLMQEVYAEVYAVLLEKGTAYLKDPHAFVRHVAKTKLHRYYTLRERLRLWVPLQARGEDGGEYDDPAVAAALAGEDTLQDDAETALLVGEIAARLRRCPPEVQRIFICYYQLGMTLRETAAALGMKESTVKAKLYRTLEQFRKIYTKEGAEP